MVIEKTKVQQIIHNELFRDGGSEFSISFLKSDSDNESGNYWHLTFPVDEPLGEIQLTLDFKNEWVDVLAFPHPHILNSDCLWEMERFVNALNGYVKVQDCNGRFYVDEETLDVAYAARISYRFIELMPQRAMEHGVLGVLSFVADVAVPLHQVGCGEMTAAEGVDYIVELWNC